MPVTSVADSVWNSEKFSTVVLLLLKFTGPADKLLDLYLHCFVALEKINGTPVY